MNRKTLRGGALLSLWGKVCSDGKAIDKECCRYKPEGELIERWKWRWSLQEEQQESYGRRG